MPKPTLVSLLPRGLQAELDEKLIANGFGGYHALKDWLDEKGYEISVSSLNRYGRDFKSKCEKIKLLSQQARAITENIGDDENSIGDALNSLAQSQVFSMLLSFDPDNPEETENTKNVDFLSLIKAVASLNRSSVSVKKFREEMKDKSREAVELIKKDGVSDQTIEDVERILGID